jgi:hypothetical protein
MKYLISLVFVTCFFLSCEKEIPFTEDDSASRIVVNSLFQADSTWKLNLTESRSLLSNDELPAITTAKAQIFNSTGELLGDFEHISNGDYVLNTPLPSAGSAYSIKVFVNGFEEVIAASSVPSTVNILSVDTSYSFKDQSYEFDIQIADEKDVANFYSVTVSRLSYWVFEGDTSFYYDNYNWTNEPFVVNGYQDFASSAKYGGEFYFTDEILDGKLINFKISSYYGFENETIYRVNVKSLSEEMYKYLLSLDKYKATDGDFFAEPVQVISNIKGGLGIFGGISQFNKQFLIE